MLSLPRAAAFRVEHARAISTQPSQARGAPALVIRSSGSTKIAWADYSRRPPRNAGEFEGVLPTDGLIKNDGDAFLGMTHIISVAAISRHT
jgi:hypothetical protein